MRVRETKMNCHVTLALLAICFCASGCSQEDEVVLWLRKAPPRFTGIAAEAARHLVEKEHGWRPVEPYESWERWQSEGRQISGSEQVLFGLLEKTPGESGLPRWLIVHALGRVGTRKSVPVLIDILRDEGESDNVRSSAAVALGRIGIPQAVTLLAELYDRFEWPDKALDELSNEESGTYDLKFSALLALTFMDDARARRIVETELRNPDMPEPDRQYLQKRLTAPQGDVPPPP